MIHINKVKQISDLKTLKQAYIDHTTTALDGMWLCGFVPQAEHYSFDIGGDIKRQTVGFCCVNDEGYLLQFYLKPEYCEHASALFNELLNADNPPMPQILGAFVSTAEPLYLGHCLDNIPEFVVNAKMYQLNSASTPAPTATVVDNTAGWTLRPVTAAEQPQMVDFVLRNLDVPEQWLVPYFTNLVERNELFACWQGDILIGTGESRGYDEYQPDYADLGMIVDKDHQGRGAATWIMQQLIELTLAKGLKPICSTEQDNIAAQKAIGRAGFIAKNRILQFKVKA